MFWAFNNLLKLLNAFRHAETQAQQGFPIALKDIYPAINGHLPCYKRTFTLL